MSKYLLAFLVLAATPAASATREPLSITHANTFTAACPASGPCEFLSQSTPPSPSDSLDCSIAVNPESGTATTYVGACTFEATWPVVSGRTYTVSSWGTGDAELVERDLGIDCAGYVFEYYQDVPSSFAFTVNLPTGTLCTIESTLVLNHPADDGMTRGAASSAWVEYEEGGAAFLSIPPAPTPASSACGLGFELSLLMPAAYWVRRRTR